MKFIRLLAGRFREIDLEESYSKTVTTTTGDFTFTFTSQIGVTFASAPRVQLTCENTSASQPTLAELVGAPTSTGCVIRTYRTKTQGVLLGGTINPTERIGAVVHVTVTGKT